MKEKLLFKEKNITITGYVFSDFIKNERYTSTFIKKGELYYIEFNGFAFELEEKHQDFFWDIGSNRSEKNTDVKIIEFKTDERLLLLQDICFNMINPNDPGYIYLYKTLDKFKIGYTNSGGSRYSKYVTENPFPVDKIFEIKINNAHKIEQQIHKLFQHKKFRNEWFDLNEKDISFLENFLYGYTHYPIRPSNCADYETERLYYRQHKIAMMKGKTNKDNTPTND